MAACNTNGFVLSACEYITDGMDSDRCIQYVEHTLAPQLGNYVLAEPRSVAAMDNVKQHQHPRIREIIEGAGAILIFLPKTGVCKDSCSESIICPSSIFILVDVMYSSHV
jgi:hypothetical protein